MYTMYVVALTVQAQRDLLDHQPNYKLVKIVNIIKEIIRTCCVLVMPTFPRLFF